jgi:hypothetical protein
MKVKIPTSAVQALSLLLLVSTAHVFAQDRRPVYFGGLINDDSPLSATVKGSPWEMRGQCSMDADPERGRADFSAGRTMSAIGKTSTGAVDPKVKLLTGKGSIALFETDPPSSSLQVCVRGGDDVRYSVTDSNITMLFGGPAVTHFGPQAIHGVVRKPLEEREGEWLY